MGYGATRIAGKCEDEVCLLFPPAIWRYLREGGTTDVQRGGSYLSFNAKGRFLPG